MQIDHGSVGAVFSCRCLAVQHTAFLLSQLEESADSAQSAGSSKQLFNSLHVISGVAVGECSLPEAVRDDDDVHAEERLLVALWCRRCLLVCLRGYAVRLFIAAGFKQKAMHLLVLICCLNRTKCRT